MSGTNITCSLNLRRLRKGNCMSQRDLSERSGLSQQYISQLENGVVDHVSVGTLKKLAAALNIKFEIG